MSINIGVSKPTKAAQIASPHPIHSIFLILSRKKLIHKNSINPEIAKIIASLISHICPVS